MREKEGSKIGPVNCLSINSTGDFFVSSGTDCVIKLWNYELGEVVAQGYGHAGIVSKSRKNLSLFYGVCQLR